jgi:hypothetical protein
MEEISSEKLDPVDVHRALTIPLSVVLPSEGNFPIVDGHQPLVGDGDPVGVTRKVLEHLLGTSCLE